MHRLPRTLTPRTQYTSIRPRIRLPRTQRRYKSQTWYRPGSDEPVRFQAVRFKKPGMTMRRVATLGIYTGIAYAYLSLIWRQLDVEIEFVEDGEAVEEGQEVTEEGEEDEEEEEAESGPFYAQEDSTFIPLTWSKKLPRTFYKGSDPEWQQFRLVAKDPARHKKIQNELVAIVFSGASQHPSISRQLGKEAQVGKYWLDISFPDGPPQEYGRSGIEIGDGFVAWSQQRVSPENQWRLMRALWPKAAADSTWATAKVLVGIQYRRLKHALGFEGRDPHAPEERFRVAVEMMEKQQQQSSTKKEAATTTQTEPAVSTTSVQQQQQTPARHTPATSEKDAQKKLPWHIPVVPIPSSASITPNTETNMDIPIAMHVFSATLNKSWNPKKMEPPRGTFVIQGLVEVRGKRGRFMFDVQSCYDPKAAKFVQVNAGVRNYKRWSQAPLGGP